MKLQELLYQIMEEKNCDFDDVANYLGLAKPTLTNKFTGSLDFTYEEIMKLATWWDIKDPLHFFFE